jgi:hypothetical protein
MAMLLAVVHAAAACCVFAFVPGPAWSTAIGLVLAASATWHVRRDALLWAPDSAAELTIYRDGHLALLLRNGVEVDGRVLGSTFVSLALVAINARLADGRARSVIVLPDSADAESRRRLRVWLRHAVRPGDLPPESGPSDRLQ